MNDSRAKLLPVAARHRYAPWLRGESEPDRRDSRVRDIVRRVDGRAAGVDVREVPGDERAVGVQAALALDDRRRPEVGPGEFLRPRPSDADRPPCRLRQPGRFDGRLGAVLAAETAAHVRNDDPDLVGGQAECPSQVPFRTIGSVAARPDGQFAVGPFRDARPRLHRRVLDVGQRVGFAEGLGRIGESPLDIALACWGVPCPVWACSFRYA